LENYNYIKYNEIYDITMNNNKNMYIKKNILSLNLEELIILEEKLCEIIIEFKKRKKQKINVSIFGIIISIFPFIKRLKNFF
jgi:hypothetical protein